MKKLLCMVLAMVMLASVMAGCGSAPDQKADGEEKDLPVLRVALMPFLISIPIVYMVEQGLDKKNGFKIETITFPTGAPMNEALGANLIDVALIGAAAVISVSTYNAKIIADIQNAGTGLEVFARPDSPAAKVKGFNPTYPEVLGNPEAVKGKTILATTGTLLHMLALKWLDTIGVEGKDTNIVHMEIAQAYQAFLAGEGDFVALNTPLSYRAHDNGWVKVASIDDLKIPLNDVLIVNHNSYDSNKEVLAKFVKVMFEVNETLEKDHALKAKVLKAWFDKNGLTVDEKNIELEAKTRPFLTAEQAKNQKVGESMKIMAEFMVTNGTLQADKLPMFDTNLTDEILKEAFK